MELSAVVRNVEEVLAICCVDIETLIECRIKWFMKNLLDEFAVNDPVEVSIIWSVVEIDWFSFILCDVDCVLR